MRKKNLSNDIGETELLTIPMPVPSDPENDSKKGSNQKLIEQSDDTPKFHPKVT